MRCRKCCTGKMNCSQFYQSIKSCIVYETYTKNRIYFEINAELYTNQRARPCSVKTKSNFCSWKTFRYLSLKRHDILKIIFALRCYKQMFCRPYILFFVWKYSKSWQWHKIFNVPVPFPLYVSYNHSSKIGKDWYLCVCKPRHKRSTEQYVLLSV